MIGWGVTFIIIGIGSYLMPLMDMQFALISLFGKSPLIGAGFIAVGAALCLLGAKRNQGQ